MMNSNGTYSLPYLTGLTLVALDPGIAPLSFLMEADEVPLMRLEGAASGGHVTISNKRLVYVNETGGMLGKRLETFSLRLSQIAGFSTYGAGGMMGEAEIKLVIAGVGELSLGFEKTSDISPLVALLTARAGVAG
jgi:hypothetical protein